MCVDSAVKPDDLQGPPVGLWPCHQQGGNQVLSLLPPFMLHSVDGFLCNLTFVKITIKFDLEDAGDGYCWRLFLFRKLCGDGSKTNYRFLAISLLL